MKKLNIIIWYCMILVVLPGFGQSSDWLSWRGPTANGSTSEPNWNLEKIKEGKGILWKTNVGTGHSAVAVKGERVYTMGNHEISENNFIDRVVCLDAQTGDIVWQFEYKMKELEDPGPFSTPVIDGGFLYTLSRGGHLYCFDAGDGTVVWMKNLIEQGLVHEKAPFACSPLIVDGLLILNINRSGLALNKRTGEKVWTSELDQDGFSTAVLFSNRGKNCITSQTNDETYALDPENGEVLWIVPEGYIPDPVFDEGRMLLFGYKGCSLYDIQKIPPERIWNDPGIKAQFQSYVKKEGFVYGFAEQGGMKLICFDLHTGTVKWSQKVSGGSLILAGDMLIVIDKEGVLRFVEASPEEFNELASAAVMNMAETDTKGRGYRRVCGCWTNPVLCNGKIYVRNTYGELVCVDVSS